MNAMRWVIVAFAPLQWLIACLALFVIQLKSKMIRIILGVTLSGLFVSPLLTQISLYRFYTGTRGDLSKDPFFFPVIMVEKSISIAILMGYAVWDITKDRRAKSR